jgi:hypothetical protein
VTYLKIYAEHPIIMIKEVIAFNRKYLSAVRVKNLERSRK